MLVALADLLAPLTLEAWRDDHVGRQALQIRGAVERLGALAEIDVERLASHREHVDVIRGGVGHAATGAAPDAPHSTRIRRLQCLDDGLAELAHAWMKTLGEEVNLNLYLSPSAETPGLAPHVDPYDAIAIQLRGRKRWELLGCREGALEDLPLTEEGRLRWGTRGELTLEPGDLLYLPKGLRHRALNHSGEPSLHLTLGIYVKTMRSCIHWLAAELDRRLDGSRPLGLFNDAADREAALEELTVAARAILDDPGRAEAFAEHREVVEYEGLAATPDEKARRPYR